ncbi:thiamine phosphate synthase [Prevotella aurantiaca]|uniref:thiamine phosphate synthase n=1 Tax=Prevotella aurantiaca TaxID=596085 RepID=UPI0028DB4FA8|nr:thiamine phosphate synthase [Prevotella aurantiaca]
MKLVVMTKSTYFVEEDKILTALFEEGLDNLHISKNEDSTLYLERLLSLIPNTYHRYITVHQHYRLKNEKSLAGIHLDTDNAVPPVGYKGLIGMTCRNSMRLKEMRKVSDYVFLGNMYTTEHKDTNEEHTFSDLELTELKNQGLLGKRVYAMGGITLDRISELKQYGFGGVVVDEEFWNQFDLHSDIDFKGIIKYFQKLQKAIE